MIVEVDFNPRPPGDGDFDPLLRVKRVVFSECRHEAGAFIVNESLRRVTCKTCGETLDPVESLLKLAREWSRYSDNLNAIKAELARRKFELEKLKTDERNTRARMRRMNGGAA